MCKDGSCGQFTSPEVEQDEFTAAFQEGQSIYKASLLAHMLNHGSIKSPNRQIALLYALALSLPDLYKAAPSKEIAEQALEALRRDFNETADYLKTTHGRWQQPTTTHEPKQRRAN